MNKVFTPGEEMGTSIFLMEIPRKARYVRRAMFYCHCGKTYESDLFAIKQGFIQSCGCLQGEHKRKFTANEVRDIRKMVWIDNIILQDIADIYKVTPTTIFNIKTDRTYKHIKDA